MLSSLILGDNKHPIIAKKWSLVPEACQSLGMHAELSVLLGRGPRPQEKQTKMVIHWVPPMHQPLGRASCVQNLVLTV